MQSNVEVWLCPKDGHELTPSHFMPLEGWMECPQCAALIALPELKDKDDLGELYRNGVDWDSDPYRRDQMIRSGRDQHPGGSQTSGRTHGKKKPKPVPIYLEDFV